MTAPILGARTLRAARGVLGADGLTLSAEEARPPRGRAAPACAVSGQRMLTEQLGLTDYGKLARPTA